MATEKKNISNLTDELTDKSGAQDFNMVIENPNPTGKPITFKMTLETLLAGVLAPDGLGNIDADSNNIINVNTLTANFLNGILFPYVLGVETRSETSGAFPTSLSYEHNLLNGSLSNWEQYEIEIRREVGKADINMLKFPAAGFYRINYNSFSTLQSSVTSDQFNITRRLFFELFEYDSGLDTVTKNNLKSKSFDNDESGVDASVVHKSIWDEGFAIWIKDPDVDRLQIRNDIDIFWTGGGSTTIQDQTDYHINVISNK